MKSHNFIYCKWNQIEVLLKWTNEKCENLRQTENYPIYKKALQIVRITDNQLYFTICE